MLLDFNNALIVNKDGNIDINEKALSVFNLYEKYNFDYVFSIVDFDFEKDNFKKYVKNQQKAFDKLEKFANKHNFKVELLLGSKIKYNSNLDYYDLSNLTLNNSDYLYLKLNKYNFPIDLYSSVSKLLAKGYKVILDTVEVYDYLFDNFQTIFKLKELGVIFLVHQNSIINSSENAKKLLEHNFIDLIQFDINENIEEVFIKFSNEYPNISLDSIKENNQLLFKEVVKKKEVDYV